MNKTLRLMRQERKMVEKNKALLSYNLELADAYRKTITTAWQGRNFAVVGIYGKLLSGVRRKINAQQFSLHESKKVIRGLNRRYDHLINERKK